jgi:hypothetical protein
MTDVTSLSGSDDGDRDDNDNSSPATSDGDEPTTHIPSEPDPVEKAAARAAASAITQNPLGHTGGMPFNLYMPELEVRMINASRFGDYEWWSFAASASLSAAVGFFVAYLQSGEAVDHHRRYEGGYLATGMVFVLLLLVFAGRAAVIRRQLTMNSRTYRMKATEIVDDEHSSDG